MARKFKRNSRRPIRRRPKRRYVGVRRHRVSGAIANMAAKIRRISPESKSRQLINYGRLLYSVSSAPFAASNILPLNFSSGAANIQQGTGNGQRVGQTCRLKKFMFKGTLVPHPYNATDNPTPKPMQVKFWFFYQRDAPTTIPNPLTDFFESNNTTAAMNGDLTDLWTPVNAAKYRLLGVRQFKLGWALNATTAAPSSAVPAAAQPNNDFKLNCNFSVNVAKMMPKLVRYVDNNVDATSRGVFVMIEPVWADGSVPPAGTIMCSMDYMLNVEYTDN